MSTFQNNNDNTLRCSETGRINRDHNRKRHLSQTRQLKLPQNKGWVSTDLCIASAQPEKLRKAQWTSVGMTG